MLKKMKKEEISYLDDNVSHVVENMKSLISLSNEYGVKKEVYKGCTENIKYWEKRLKDIKSWSYFFIGNRLSMCALIVMFFTVVSSVSFFENSATEMFETKVEKTLREKTAQDLIFKDIKIDTLSEYDKIGLSSIYLSDKKNIDKLSDEDKYAVKAYHKDLLRPVSNGMFLFFSLVTLLLWFEILSTRKKEIKEKLASLEKWKVRLNDLISENEIENIKYSYENNLKKYLDGNESIELKKIYKQLHISKSVLLNRVNEKVIDMKYGNVILNADLNKNYRIPYQGDEHLNEVIENENIFKRDIDNF